MIKNVIVYGFNESIIRSGYPMQTGEPKDLTGNDKESLDNINRAIKLANVPSGSGHDNYLKGVIVQFDLQYPEYFSPQLQRYSWIDIISSQSKMHKITSRKLTKYDFTSSTRVSIIEVLNNHIGYYNDKGRYDKKEQFNFIISNLPSGYLKWMAISTNYLQLKTIYKQRRHHKLTEWQEFCDWIESLPMSNLITGKK